MNNKLGITLTILLGLLLAGLLVYATISITQEWSRIITAGVADLYSLNGL